MNLENESPLRPCGGGGGHHLGHDSRSFGGVYFCPAHLQSLFHGFNPRPYGQGGSDDVVKFIDGDRRTFCVLAREGDILTLRVLGNPDAGVQYASVHEVYPATPGAVYRSVPGSCRRTYPPGR